jgi:hypothetical protein
MFALARAPTHIYNTIKKTDESKSSRGGRHWRQYSGRTVHRQNFAMSPKQTTDDALKIEKLEHEVDRYKKANKKLRMIASWNLRAAQSAFKDSENILQILDDLYGDDAYEKLSN